MSVRITVELRNEEGMFGTKRLSKDDIAAMLDHALRQKAFTTVEGPFADGVVQVFTMEIADPREQWHTGSQAGRGDHPTR